jgi:hypothetical protein
MPAALARAELILGLCREFHCLPSQLEGEDVELLRLLAIERLGNPNPDSAGGDVDGW